MLSVCSIRDNNFFRCTFLNGFAKNFSRYYAMQGEACARVSQPAMNREVTEYIADVRDDGSREAAAQFNVKMHTNLGRC